MTEQHSESPNYIEDNEQLIARYQNILIRQVEAAYQKGEMDPDVYLNFLSKVCEAETKEGIYDYFETVFNELADYHEERIQERIVKGAEYIELIGPSHKKYKAAMQRYNELCKQLQERRRSNDRSGRNRSRREQELG